MMRLIGSNISKSFETNVGILLLFCSSSLLDPFVLFHKQKSILIMTAILALNSTSL
jgi:hypothetical protein